MEGRVISAINIAVMVLGMLMYIVTGQATRQASGQCTYPSYNVCYQQCQAMCSPFRPKKDCAPFCQLSCSACPGAPPSNAAMTSPAPSTLETSVRVNSAPPPKVSGQCTFPSYNVCYQQCQAGCSKLGTKESCAPFCQLSCSACPGAPPSSSATSTPSPSTPPMTSTQP